MTAPKTAGDIAEGLSEIERDDLLFLCKTPLLIYQSRSQRRLLASGLLQQGDPVLFKNRKRPIRYLSLTDLGKQVAQELQKRGGEQ